MATSEFGLAAPEVADQRLYLRPNELVVFVLLLSTKVIQSTLCNKSILPELLMEKLNPISELFNSLMT